MPHVDSYIPRARAGSRRAFVAVVVLLAATLTSFVSTEQAGARPRCWPKGSVCDTTPPDTTLTAGPSGTITTTSVSFGFSASEAGSTFQCRLDAGSWAACSSPRSYSALIVATHTFDVRAVDLAGNVDPTAATRIFTVASTTTSTTTPTTTPPSGAKATTRPVGSPALSDADAAARVTRSSWEPRPGNYVPNHRVPTLTELSGFRSLNTTPAAYRDKVTGNFTGTTDEIIQWAAHKWGVDEELVRAAAVKESWWDQAALGDGGISFGLMQIKSTVSKGTYPLSQVSTAFNVDYFGATIRYYYDGGATWLNDACCFSGATYAAGDIWGSIGAWFAGRWYTAGAVDYINSVSSHFSARTWVQPGF